MNSNTSTPMAAVLLLAVLLGVAWVGGMLYTLTAWATGS
ncbi:morphogenic membrane protein MmpA [Streptomyces sp. NPDC050504]